MLTCSRSPPTSTPRIATRRRRAGAQRGAQRAGRERGKRRRVAGRARASLRARGPRRSPPAHEDLRAMLGVAQHASSSLKREVERLRRIATATAVSGTRAATARTAGRPRSERSHRRSTPTSTSASRISSGDPRGDPRAAESYVPFFDWGDVDVLDVGCGRGEFLELLDAAGIPARGIDLNHEMAELCRARGLDVTEADAVGYLASLPDAFARRPVRRPGRRAPRSPATCCASSIWRSTSSTPAARSCSRR